MRSTLLAGLIALSACTEDKPAASEAPENRPSARLEQPPAPPGPGAAPPSPVRGSYYATRYGVSEEEAMRRNENEEHVSSLARSLRLDPVSGFSDLWIEHEPRYAIVLAFKHPPDRDAILKRAHPSIHRDIDFRSAKRSRAEIARDQDRLIAILRKSPGQWAGGYDVKTGKFVFDFTSAAGVAYGERNLPDDLREDVVLRVGSVPAPLSR